MNETANQISYRCPNCGGALTFRPDSANYGCAYCGSRFSLEELEARCGVQEGAESDPAGETGEQAAGGDQAEGDLVSYSCPSCGAQILTDESTVATFCYYCHNTVILSGRLKGAHRPDYVIPFAIDRKKALSIFSSWIGQKRFVPRSFYDQQQIDTLSGVYFPYLLYRCDIRAHVDTEGRRVSRTSTGSFEEITTSVYRVKRDGTLTKAAVARNALKKRNRLLAEAVQPFDTAALKPFHMSYLSGFVAERKDLSPDEIIGEIEREVREYAGSKLRSQLSEYEGISLGEDNIQVSNGSWSYALMPVWTMTYREKGSDRLYYFSLNGQSGKVVGELPVDRGALLRYMLFLFAAVFIPLLALSYFLF